MELKGTKTEKNLWEAFAGESQARNKYTFFASVAVSSHKRRQREFGSLFVAIGQTACHNLSKEYREERHGRPRLRAVERTGAV